MKRCQSRADRVRGTHILGEWEWEWECCTSDASWPWPWETRIQYEDWKTDQLRRGNRNRNCSIEPLRQMGWHSKPKQNAGKQSKARKTNEAVAWGTHTMC